MKKYNFEDIHERRGTHSIKYDFLKAFYTKEDLLSMWVADMDFQTADEIIDTVVNVAKTGIYGYCGIDDDFYNSIIHWFSERRNLVLDKEWIMFVPGIVPAISISLLGLTVPGDKIILQPPVYYPFYSCIENNGRRVVFNNLINENGYYKMDFEALERSIDVNTRVLILCNPHNPVGRVWTENELSMLGEICKKNDLIIFSDEIHSDLIYEKDKFKSIFSLNEDLRERTVTFFAPSKTFNLAGLSTSFMVVPNRSLRGKMQSIMNSLALNNINMFGLNALIAAYSHGGEWLDQLLNYLKGNIDYVLDFFEKKLPQVKIFKPEGTYLLWMDFRFLGLNDEELSKFFIEKVGVALDDGYIFGRTGSGFQRMNIACSRKIVCKACEKIYEAVKLLENC
ncbi:MAG TPA: MalY/PatB family protein [Petrotogaceae bacterium]|nr:MalY/PatB family protein [Petrotogaceae bacterium]